MRPDSILCRKHTFRVHAILLHRSGVLPRHDIHRGTSVRSLKPIGLHLHLLPRWISVRYGHQRLRNRGEAYPVGEQPIHAS